METIKTQVLIIGGGAAGLNAALNIKNKDVVLIEKAGSNSVICPWNLMINTKKELRRKILETGNRLNDLNLVDTFLDDCESAVKDLKKLKIKLRRSNLGLIPDYPLPGLEVRKIFLQKLKDKKIKKLSGEVYKFLLDKDKEIIGVKASLPNSKKLTIFFDHLILGAGGLAGFFPFITGSRDCGGRVLSLCCEAGLSIKDLEFFMFHPFLVIDKRLPRLLVSGDILTKMEYEDENGKSFLSEEIAVALRTNKHHYVFPQMTKEFYLQSLKGKIFGRFVCSAEWFEDFKKKNEFGFVFKKFKKDDLEKIELHPAFHFSIGGLVINKNGQTSQKNIYAAGEITGGLHGSNRIGGLAILEALIFGKRAALDINKRTSRKKDFQIAEEIGDIGISQRVRQGVWQALGPVKNKEKLWQFKKLLDKKKSLSSSEKLLQKITEICLLRKESIGAFYREDLKEKKKAPSSFLINKDIVFK